jgi:Tfp pilus assembly protein PilE
MKHTQGFTVIEVIVVTLFLSVATTVLFMQKNNIAATHRDDQRKTAINAMYYGLEEVYFAKNKNYPAEITDKTLVALDPALLTDPDGKKIGDKDSDYRYEGINCTNDVCQAYTIRADLEKEADFVKTNRKH